MPAPSPSTKPSRSRSKGREALVGSSLRVLRAVSRLKPVTPKGWIMRVRAAGEHHVGLAAADDLDRLADGLAAGGAGRQAVDVRPLGVEQAGQVAGRHVRLLLQLGDRVEDFQALAGELGQVELSPPPRPATIISREAVEVLLALAAAGVDAEAGGIELGQVEARVGHGLLGGADGEVGVPALVLPVLGVLAHVGEVPVADLGRDLGGEVAGVEQRGVADARLAVRSRRHTVSTSAPSGVTQPMPVTTTRRLMGTHTG